MRHATNPHLAAATSAIWLFAVAIFLIPGAAAAEPPEDAAHNVALLRSDGPQSGDARRGTASGYGASNCGTVNNVPAGKPARVLTRPNLAAILWNSSVWSELQTNAPLFYSDLEQAGSSYLPSLSSDYGVSTGTYRGMFTITPKTYNTGTKCSGGVCTISESDINTELSYQITNNASGIPTPEGDGVDGKGFANNLLYLVHLPPNYVLKDNNGAAECGFHDQMKDNAGNTVAVAYMADMSPGSTCAGQQAWTDLGPIVDAFQMASHEIGEAAVNPFPQTKYNGEIGDRCQCNLYYTGFPGIGGTAAWTTFAGASRTWVVQQPYMQSTKACQTMQLAPPVTQNANNSSTFAYASPTSGTIGEVWAPIAGTLGAASWSSSTGWINQIVYIGGAVVAGSQIAAVAKDTANFYAFYIGVDGNLWVSWFNSTLGWTHFAVTGLVSLTGANFPAPPGGGVSAVTTGTGNLAAYFVDNLGLLHGIGWSSTGSGNGWHVIPGDPLAIAVPPGASVAALKRSNLNNDVLFVGLDGGIWDVSQFRTGAWSISEVPGTPLLSNAGSRIAAVARSWNKLDVFFADILGNAKTAFWSEDLGLWSVTSTTGNYRAGGGISAVTRSPFNLDTFFVDGAGVENVAWNHWNGPNGDQWILTRAQANTGLLNFPLGENVAATARLPVQMDVFDLTNLLVPYTEFWSGGAWGSSSN